MFCVRSATTVGEPPSFAVIDSSGPKKRNGSIEISTSPASAATYGVRAGGGDESGFIASSGLIRVASHAGSAPAASAVSTEPIEPKPIPHQSGETPAVKTS